MVISCLLELATITLVELSTNNEPSNVQMRRRAIKAMISSEIDDPEEMAGVLLLVYGTSGSMKREELVKTLCSQKCNWLLHGSLIRDRMENFLSEDTLQQMGF